MNGNRHALAMDRNAPIAMRDGAILPGGRDAFLLLPVLRAT